MPEPNARLFRAQHYNAIAKDIRETMDKVDKALPPDEPGNRAMVIACNRTIAEVAIALAKRFAVDNSHFDPLYFLDACSPNPDLYPLSELWEKKENG